MGVHITIFVGVCITTVSIRLYFIILAVRGIFIMIGFLACHSTNFPDYIQASVVRRFSHPLQDFFRGGQIFHQLVDIPGNTLLESVIDCKLVDDCLYSVLHDECAVRLRNGKLQRL